MLILVTRTKKLLPDAIFDTRNDSSWSPLYEPVGVVLHTKLTRQKRLESSGGTRRCLHVHGICNGSATPFFRHQSVRGDGHPLVDELHVLPFLLANNGRIWQVFNHVQPRLGVCKNAGFHACTNRMHGVMLLSMMNLASHYWASWTIINILIDNEIFHDGRFLFKDGHEPSINHH